MNKNRTYKKSLPCNLKFGVVMDEFYKGILHSGLGQGHMVTNRKQAEAIAFSETRKCKSRRKK